LNDIKILLAYKPLGICIVLFGISLSFTKIFGYF